MGQNIICEHCKSRNVAEGEYTAVVQQMTNDGVPMGKKKVFTVYTCRDCGKDFYIEEFSSYAN